MGRPYTVRQGDCLTSIAYRFGFSDWRVIYNHPDNADFRRRRPDPNVLYPGDVLAIPDLEPRRFTLQTNSRHSLRIKRPVAYLRVIVRDEHDHPIANAPYTLLVGAQTFTGTTSGAGLVEHRVPATETDATLEVELAGASDSASSDSDSDAHELPAPDPSNEHAVREHAHRTRARETARARRTVQRRLQIGFLDPVELLAGVQGRLLNLGLYDGPIDNAMTDATRDAIRAFQAHEGLEPTGELDAQLRSLIDRRHQSR